MKKIACSVGILTFNSEKTLRRALESVKAFDDIIVCDGGSTDNTRIVAQEYGARILDQKPEFKNENGSLRDYAGVRNQCLDAARHDWFFYIDSDEIATPELVEEIRGIVANSTPTTLAFNISPRIVLEGRIIEYSSNYPGWQKRFFSRSSGARFYKPIHERLVLDTTKHKEGFLKGHWHYFVSRQVDRAKYDKYVRMDALRYQTRDTRRLLELTIKKCLTISKILTRALYNAVVHPRESMPLALEGRRARYEATVLRLLLLAYLGKTSEAKSYDSRGVDSR